MKSLSCGPDVQTSDRRNTFLIGRWLFIRFLGLVYLVAFVSLGLQIRGLIGSHGLLPAHSFLSRASELLGWRAFLKLPTFFWITDSDAALVVSCWLGAAASLAVVAGFLPALNLLFLWVLYLSLCSVGQVFLGFQWDALLLEAGLIAVLYATWNRFDSFPYRNHPPVPRPLKIRVPPEGGSGCRLVDRLMPWMLRLLLFKLMLLSGVTKLASGDETWLHWTALDFHYETQPLPTWTAWYMNQLPSSFQHLSLAFMWFVELVVPFCYLVPARWRTLRLLGAASTILFQLCLAATGNFAFFNLLTITLCLPLLDDRLLGGLESTLFSRRSSQVVVTNGAGQGRRPLKSLLSWLYVILILPISFLVATEEVADTAGWTATQDLFSETRPVLDLVSGFRSVNGYGLFRVMTTRRPEIVVETSVDGVNWEEYPFRWKPGDPERRPRFVAPYQPRLDWQMWFAALDPRRNQSWLLSLVRGILRGTPAIVRLLGQAPGDGSPPVFVKLVYYQYEMTTWGNDTGRRWWNRQHLGELTPPLSLDDFSRE